MHVIDAELRRFGRLLHYAGVLATVVCAAAGYSFLHGPSTQSIASTSERIDELAMFVRNVPIMREQHQKVTEKLDEVTTRIAEVRARVPSQADAGEFLKQLTHVATAEQLVIKDFTPGKPEDKDGYAEMQVTLRGVGSYASICRFVDMLSKMKRLSKVQDLTLSAEGNASEYPMTATLVIYFGLRGKDVDPAKSPEERRRG
jgi:Tfp pilus assembly protein PilO